MNALRDEIAHLQSHVSRLEMLLLPLAQVPISVTYAGPNADGLDRQAVIDARSALGLRYGLVTDEATFAETLQAFQRWLANARPGAGDRPADLCMYLDGYLAGSMYVASTHANGRDGAVEKPPVATAAMTAAEAGLVHLVQVKLAEGRYRYYAIRASVGVEPRRKRNNR